MRSFLPVSARRLHTRPVRLRDAVLEEASLFPFFDAAGDVRSLMLVSPASSSILLLEAEADLARVPWLGPVELGADLAEHRDSDAGHAEALAGGLWHYDPWWALKASRYEGHPAVPVLKATNCVDLFPKPVVACYFARDLTRVVGFARKGHSGAEIDRTLLDYLPVLVPPEAEPSPGPSPTGWTLDPFWQRRTGTGGR